jgi:hypothetical protein
MKAFEQLAVRRTNKRVRRLAAVCTNRNAYSPRWRYHVAMSGDPFSTANRDLRLCIQHVKIIVGIV